MLDYRYKFGLRIIDTKSHSTYVAAPCFFVAGKLLTHMPSSSDVDLQAACYDSDTCPSARRASKIMCAAPGALMVESQKVAVAVVAVVRPRTVGSDCDRCHIKMSPP